MSLREIIKHIVLQLTPYYTLESLSVITFSLGYSVGKVLSLHPTTLGMIGGLIPPLVTLYFLPSHFEKGNKFKLFGRVVLKDEYHTEVVKDMISKLREIEKEMEIDSNISYIITKSLSMGAIRLSKNNHAVIIPLDFVDKYGGKTYILTVHELAHIKLKHLIKMKYLYVALLTLSSLATLASFSFNTMIVGVVFTITPIIMNTVFIHFQRKWEKEADALTVKIVNPLEFSSLLKNVTNSYKQFEELNHMQKKHRTIFKLIIPHDNINERIERINI